jgi:hypothetical protein
VLLMSAYIRIVGTADGEPTDAAWQFVQEYEPAAMDFHGVYHGGVLRLTRDIRQALRFADKADAFALYLKTNGRRPRWQA